MEKFLPVPIPDEGEAGSVWRLEKLKDFAWKIKCLGMEDAPEFQQLQGMIESCTQELEKMWEEQKDPGYEKKWWQDGEYDAQRADRFNDIGLERFQAKEWGDAFDAFTEAIRLHPTSSTYHCNRAAVGLKLGKGDIALQDALHAIDADSMNVKAYVRAGKACLLLDDPEKGLYHFHKAQELDCDDSGVRKGIEACYARLQDHQDREDEYRRIADAGERRPLPVQGCSEEEATLLLLSADDMLRVHPKNEYAIYMKVEALILCGRYAQAADCALDLRSGVEKSYLQAEYLWRDGDVDAALKKLEAIQYVTKCDSLHKILVRYQSEVHMIEKALDDGIYLDAIEKCDQMLANISLKSCQGLYCRIMKMRAKAYCCRGMYLEAKSDLEVALGIRGEDLEARRTLADILRERGEYINYFLEVQRIKKIDPSVPGLTSLIEEAARLGLEESRRKEGAPVGETVAHGALSSFEALGIQSSATVTQVRNAYLKLAAKWHPDKWSLESEHAKKEAEEKFKLIKQSYEQIMEQSVR